MLLSQTIISNLSSPITKTFQTVINLNKFFFPLNLRWKEPPRTFYVGQAENSQWGGRAARDFSLTTKNGMSQVLQTSSSDHFVAGKINWKFRLKKEICRHLCRNIFRYLRIENHRCFFRTSHKSVPFLVDQQTRPIVRKKLVFLFWGKLTSQYTKYRKFKKCPPLTGRTLGLIDLLNNALFMV